MPVFETVEVRREVPKKRQVVHRRIDSVIKRIEHLFHAGYGRVMAQTGVVGAQLPTQIQQIIVSLIGRK